MEAFVTKHTETKIFNCDVSAFVIRGSATAEFHKKEQILKQSTKIPK